MALSKKDRKAVWNKSDGVCWYCGENLPEKGWHADHFVPILRESVYIRDNSKPIATLKAVNTGKSLRPHHDKLSNIVPSCAPCNLFKAAFDVEFFRQEIEAQIERVRQSSSGYRIAERMGLIEAKPRRVVFWFEKQKIKPYQAINNSQISG